MFATMLFSKKRGHGSIAAVTDPYIPTNRLLYIKDNTSKHSFLVDTGAEVSVVPASYSERFSTQTNSPNLRAANNTIIKTYGRKKINLDLDLDRHLTWAFLLADVSKPILGADFLEYYGLTVDLKKRLLLDPQTSHSKKGSLTTITKDHYNLSVISFEENEYSRILKEFPNLLKPADFSKPPKHSVKHYILTDGPPYSTKARRLDPDRLEIAKKEFQKMVDLGICRQSSSEWASPLHMVRKSNGSWRPCGDYRGLNLQTKSDKYPLPHIHDLVQKVQGCTIFSKIDLVKAYHQIPVNESDIPKTAIITPFGLFEFNRMNFGVKNAAQTFQRFMDHITKDLGFVLVYLDDMLVASKTPSEHKKHLRRLFQRLDEHGLQIQLEKCLFGVPEIEFLAQEVTSNGIKPSLNRVKAILDFPKPTFEKDLFRFLGMINYYHRFIPNCSSILEPLRHILPNSNKKPSAKKVNWTDVAYEAFKKAKQVLSARTLLQHPIPDAPLSLKVDASLTGAGAVLQQCVNGEWKPICFFSRSFIPAQRKYSTFDRELLATYMAVRHFRHFLEAKEFTIFTDHKPLTSALHSSTDKLPRQSRHLSYIAEFTNDIQYVPGNQNEVADALSRSVFSAVKDDISDLDYMKIALAQKDDTETQELISSTNGSCRFSTYKLPGTKLSIICEVSTGYLRPVIPSNSRKLLFESIHNLSHPSIRETRRQITKRVFWPSMNADITEWARTCTSCQRSKIQQHPKIPISKFEEPGQRFHHVHIDIVGPLPSCQGYTHLLTCIDRFTRWPEAIPLSSTTAEDVAKAFLANWVARFGCPAIITTDRGPQFSSQLFVHLTKLLNSKFIQTTPYHPQSNGMIERFHRHLKTSLRCSDRGSWLDSLPLTLLGIRTSLKEDLGFTPSQATYGTDLRLPSDLPSDDLPPAHPSNIYLKRLKDCFKNLNSEATHHLKKSPSNQLPDPTPYEALSKNFQQKSSLDKPYSDPFKVGGFSSKIIQNTANKKFLSKHNVKQFKKVRFFFPRRGNECSV